jgi:DNA-directed RNA polymerase
MDLSREDVRRELDLEAEARSLGAARYERSRPMPWRTAAGSAVDEEANLPPGQQLLRLAVEPTAAAIREFVEKANDGSAGRRHSAVKWLELASPEEVAYLTIRTTINYSAGRATFQSAAIAVANAVIEHVDMVTFSGKNPNGYYGFIRKTRFQRGNARRMTLVRKMLADEEARTAISRAEKLHLGAAAIELFIDATGFFTLDQRGRAGTYTLTPTEAVQKWITEQHARSALLDPVFMPMVVRPRRWRSLWTGGYLRQPGGKGLVRESWSSRGISEALASADLSLVYEAVNHIQETPWRINRRVFEVMRAVWDGGGNLGGLPPRDDLPMPPKPADIDTNEDARKAWRAKAAEVYDRNARLFSARVDTQQRLWVAQKFADEAAIWFPHSVDFRGRVYPIPSNGVHPQGDDGSKALLEFAHGLPLGKSGGYWLAVHIANLFGVDKVSFMERVEWTHDHARELIDSALDPLDGERFWTQADSPWMALAAAFEFAGWLEHGDTYVSHLPIPLDGSNSGLQHFSALLRDPAGARAVNLVPSQEPNDVYAEVARIAQDHVDADADPRAAPWRGKVSRKIAKRPTMTYVYSATRYGTQDMILQTLKELDEEGEPYLGGADNYDAANYLSHIMFAAIAKVVSAATSAMEWLRAVARIASDAGVPLQWTTPDGFVVYQDYRQPVGQRIEVHWRGSKLALTLKDRSSSPSRDGRAQANGIAPNYIHSLDAAHLRALARAARAAGIDHLGVVHDSFATHAARADDLATLLRDTFVAQYRPSLLERFRDEIVATVPEAWKDQVPPPPPVGSLDLEEVRYSTYLFA